MMSPDPQLDAKYSPVSDIIVNPPISRFFFYRYFSLFWNLHTHNIHNKQLHRLKDVIRTWLPFSLVGNGAFRHKKARSISQSSLRGTAISTHWWTIGGTLPINPRCSSNNRRVSLFLAVLSGKEWWSDPTEDVSKLYAKTVLNEARFWRRATLA